MSDDRLLIETGGVWISGGVKQKRKTKKKMDIIDLGKWCNNDSHNEGGRQDASCRLTSASCTCHHCHIEQYMELDGGGDDDDDDDGRYRRY